jgi:hypothetical protein
VKAEDFLTSEGVGKHRAEETEVLVSYEIKHPILNKRIKLTNYKEFSEQVKRSKN